MIEMEIYQGEPVGLPQETFGADIVQTCTNTALDHFFEAKNAAMGPFLNAPGLAMLYADDAVLEVQLPGPTGMMETTCRGHAEIQAFFEDLAKLMLSIVIVEDERKISGHTATWRGKVYAVEAGDRAKIEIDALYKLTFDESDRVVHQWSRLTPRPAD